MMKMTRMLVVVLFFLVCIPIYAAERHQVQVGQDPQDMLSFVWSEEVIRYPADIHCSNVNAILPGYAAQLYVAHWQGQGRKVLVTEGIPHFSPEQQAFMTQRPFYQILCTEGTAYQGYNQIRLYAVSREEAGKMAHFMIDTLTRQAQTRKAHLLQEKGGLEQRLAQHQQERDRIARELNSLRQAFAELTDVDRYRTLAAEDAADVAQQRIVTLTAESDQARADRAECQAVIDSITAHVARLKTDNLPDTGWAMARLDTVGIEHQARLEGLQARLQVIDRTLEEEKKLRTLYQQMHGLQQQQGRIARAMEKARSRLADLTRQWASPAPELWEPVVFEDRVEICAVQCSPDR